MQQVRKAAFMTVLPFIILELLFGVCASAACLSSQVSIQIPIPNQQTGPQCGLLSPPLELKDCAFRLDQHRLDPHRLVPHGTASQRTILSSEHTSTQQALRQENRSLSSVDGRSGSNGAALIQRNASRLNSPWNRLHSSLVSRPAFALDSVQVILCRWHA